MVSKTAHRVINFSFYILAFLTPLVFYTKTSELFEFNKMVLTYSLTIVSVSAWVVVMITQKRFVFRRTVLDFPLLLFLLAQYISTLLSMDPRTSLLGYYSRFHGGLFSSISYALLYWCYVSNMSRKKTLNVVYALLSSAFVVAVYALLQKAGIDKDVWVQDVQSRVFSTLGQPNWLAAWIVALIPITWAFALISKPNLKNTLLWLGLSAIFFTTLLFTKSRSGLLGLLTGWLIFWLAIGLLWVKTKRKFFNLSSVFLQLAISFLVLILLFGTPWSKPLFQGKPEITNPTTTASPALEVGGTDSADIRKIVWQGAIDVWKANPLVGSGVETFAYSFYQHRPTELNLTSEWDYLYNKAHNEYLNFAATSGTLGLLGYLTLIVFSILQISNIKLLISKLIPMTKLKYSKIGNYLGQLKQFKIRPINIALLAGYVSILVTNFFGFSVVPVALEFFLFPAMAITLSSKLKTDNLKQKSGKMLHSQKLGIIIVFSLMFYVLSAIYKYWLADYYYSTGKIQGDNSNYEIALDYLDKALALAPTEPVYWTEYSLISANAALNSVESSKAEALAKSAVDYSEAAVSLSPNNVNFKKNCVNVLILLSSFNDNYLTEAVSTLQAAVKLAPTDAKLVYNLAIAQLRIGEIDQSVATLQKTIDLKSNYKEARYAYALVLKEQGQKNLAIQELTYILEKIDPTDEATKRELNEMTSSPP